MKRILHKALSMLLTVAMVLSVGLTPVFAEGTNPPGISGISGICTHHTEHTKDCEYQGGTPCNHEHAEECYTKELTCALVEGEAPEIATDSEAPAGEAHSHGEDCYTQTETCQHKHDTCGYTADSSCTFDPASCDQCNHGGKPQEKTCTCPPVDSGEPVHGVGCPLYTAPELSEAVKALIAMVDALLNADAITEENKEATKPAYEAAAMAYEALSDADKAAFEQTKQYKKLMALQDMLFDIALMEGSDSWDIDTGDFILGDVCGNSCKGHTVWGETRKQNGIIVKGGTHDLIVTAKILRHWNPDFYVDGNCAFLIEGKSTVTLKFGNNDSGEIQSTKSHAGIEVEAGSTLIFDHGTNNNNNLITIVGGDLGGAGIGGKIQANGRDGGGGEIVIKSGRVSATGNTSIRGSSVTITGGKVTAKSDIASYGINADKITITDGEVTADSIFAGAGGIEITGGNITANGRSSYPAIGGGSEDCSVTITGGTVRAQATSNAAGIGGGWGQAMGPIIIGGDALVYATGGTIAPGIGSGTLATASCDITIDDNAVVFAQHGSTYGRIIDNIGTGNDGIPAKVNRKSGIIFEGGKGILYGGTMSKSFTVKPENTDPYNRESEQTLEIPAGKTLMIQNGATLTNYGTINNLGTVQNDGTIINGGTLIGDGKLTGNGTVKPVLSDDMITLPDSKFYYTGSPVCPTVTVASATPAWGKITTYVEDVDYTVKYENNTNFDQFSYAQAVVTPTADGGLAGGAVKHKFKILQSGTSFDGGVKTYNDTVETDTFAYGDTITVKVTPTAAKSRLAPPADNDMALFLGETQITERHEVISGVEITFTINTAKKQLNIGVNDLTAKYIGSKNMAGRDEFFRVTLTPKPLKADTSYSGAKKYDGSPNVNNVVLKPVNSLPEDKKVYCRADGIVSDVNVGTSTFTAISTTLFNEDAQWYSLAPEDVSGDVEIIPTEILMIDHDDERTIVKDATSFQAPAIIGSDGKAIPGAFEYTYNGNTYTDYAVLGAVLAALPAESTVVVTYVFNITPGNYAGSVSGRRIVHVADLGFEGLGDAIKVKQNPVYGDSWRDILTRGETTPSANLDGTAVPGKFSFYVDGELIEDVDGMPGTAIPDAKTHTYQLNFTADSVSTATNVEALFGEFTVAKREAELNWSGTEVTYDGLPHVAVPTVSNKVGSDELDVIRSGWQTEAGSHTATAVGLTGDNAANYTLPAGKTESFTINPQAAIGEVKLSLHGTELVGSGVTVTADISGVTPTAGTASYRWKKTVGDITSDIAGATAKSYTLTDSDTKGEIFCVVTFSGNVSGEKISNKVTIAKKPLQGAIVLSGIAVVGEALTTVSTPTNAGVTDADYTIAWYRNGVVIPGATAASYTLTNEDRSKTIHAVITAKDTSEEFTGSLTSNKLTLPSYAPKKPVITAAAGNNSVTISWAKPGDNGFEITGYTMTVKQGETSVAGSPFAVDADATSYTVKNLTKGTEYNFMLTATNAEGSTNSDVIKETPTGPASGGSGGNNGGATTPPANNNQGNSTPPTIAEVKVPAEVDDKGNATVTVSDKNVDEAIKKAQDEAKKNGTEKNGIAVTINVTTDKEANSVSTKLQKAAVDHLIVAGVTQVKIQSDTVDITIDLATLKEIQKTIGSDVAIKASKVDNHTLSKEAQLIFGNRMVLDLSIVGINGKAISDFGKGRVMAAIPYTLQQGEEATKLQVIHIDADGKAHPMADSKYDSATKSVVFTTDHFSLFGVGYKPETITFTDTATHWAKDDIEFVAARGLLTGTTATTFSPNTSMTRGMFVTALGRLAGVDPNSYKVGSFTDVKAEAYYAPYVNWAVKNNIVTGTSTTTFAPDRAITRQEMAVMTANYAKAMGYKLPSVHKEIVFTDSASIGTWAKTAVKEMQIAGILMGKEVGKFEPTDTATRAEVSAMLHRFVELVS